MTSSNGDSNSGIMKKIQHKESTTTDSRLGNVDDDSNGDNINSAIQIIEYSTESIEALDYDNEIIFELENVQLEESIATSHPNDMLPNEEDIAKFREHIKVILEDDD